MGHFVDKNAFDATYKIFQKSKCNTITCFARVILLHSSVANKWLNYSSGLLN